MKLLLPLLLYFLVFSSSVKAQELYKTTWVTNVPLYDVDRGNSLLDGNNRTVIWAGKVSSGDNYFDVRLVGSKSEMIVRVQIIDKTIENEDTFNITIKNKSYSFPYSTGYPTVQYRCDEINGCRGWSVDLSIKWEDLGGKPSIGDIWDLNAEFIDKDSTTVNWSGKIKWGLLQTNSSEVGTKVTLPLKADTNVGGNMNCGGDDSPLFFPTWGNKNYGTDRHITAWNQWDIADWPCFSKEYMSWDLSTIPTNVTINKATLSLWHFGDNGYGNCYADDATKDTVYELFDVNSDFNETAITWDNSPKPRENVSRTLVTPARKECNNGIEPPFERVFDVTEITRRAINENRNFAATLMYTSAGQYHSGKQFYSKEGPVPPKVVIYYSSNNITPSASPTASVTPSFNPKFDVNLDGRLDLGDALAMIAEIFR